MEDTLFTASEDIQSLLSKSIDSRFENLTNLCPVSNRPNSAGDEQKESFAQGCSPNVSFEAFDCTLPEAICPVPCGVSIINRTDTNENGTVFSTTTLTICSLEKEDELSYTCLAMNGVPNVLNTSEAVTANLIVQGQSQGQLLIFQL